MADRTGYLLGHCDPHMDRLYDREGPNHHACTGLLGDRFFCTCLCHKPAKKLKKKLVRVTS